MNRFHVLGRQAELFLKLGELVVLLDGQLAIGEKGADRFLIFLKSFFLLEVSFDESG